MGPDLAAALRDGPAKYAGEDTRLTSKKELAGWYAYAFAAEVFVVCGMGESRISQRLSLLSIIQCTTTELPLADTMCMGMGAASVDAGSSLRLIVKTNLSMAAALKLLLFHPHSANNLSQDHSSQSPSNSSPAKMVSSSQTAQHHAHQAHPPVLDFPGHTRTMANA